jgi:NAD-dependent dihydropyrimidine dehydrogenase PreA subunit
MKGYEEVPTLLVTGETMAHVTRILRSGAEEYRSIGTAESPGSKLFQVSGSVERPGIYEAPLGTSLRTLLQDHAGGIKASPALKAVIVGGIKGVCLTPDELAVTLDFATVRRAGGTMGSGAVEVLDETTCIVDETKRRIAVSCYDLCAACSLGREGAYQLREIVADAARGKSRGSDVEMMRELGAGMKAGAACQFGRTAPNIVLSALDKFPDEWEAHMKRKLCRALVCDQYVTFHILPDLCDGCGECVDVCPEDCIEGGRNKIHVIDQDDCVKCGRCLEVCNGLRRAVVKAGPIKPRTRPSGLSRWAVGKAEVPGGSEQNPRGGLKWLVCAKRSRRSCWRRWRRCSRSRARRSLPIRTSWRTLRPPPCSSSPSSQRWKMNSTSRSSTKIFGVKARPSKKLSISWRNWPADAGRPVVATGSEREDSHG